MDWLDDLFRARGLAEIVVADTAAPTIVSDTDAKAFVIAATASPPLTAPRRIALPNKVGAPWVVWNQTTQVLNAGGQNGGTVAIAAGTNALIFSDGTDFHISASSASALSGATPTTLGTIQLAGDLGGVATAPTVESIGGATAAQVASVVTHLSVGAYAPLNAATTHQFKCLDASGNLVNSVAGAANPLVQTHAGGGVAGAFVSYQDLGLFHRGTFDVRLTPDLYAQQGDFFYFSAASLAVAAGYSVEAILQTDVHDDSVAGRQCAVGLADTPATNRLEIGLLGGAGGYLYAMATNGTAIAWALAAAPSRERVHVMATISTAGALVLYVDGAPSTSNDGAVVLGAPFTRCAVGNTPLVVDAAANFAGFRGRVADVRLTPAVLTKAYTDAAVAAAGAL